MTGRKCADVAIERKGFGHITPEVEPGNACRLRVLAYTTAGQERLDLARVTKSPAIIAVVEWFNPVWVAGKKQLSGDVIPDRKGKHAAQKVDHRRSVTGVEMEERFRVAVGSIPDAGRYQLAPQRRDDCIFRH